MNILIAIPAIALAYCIYAFNRLVRSSNLVKEAWSGIDVQLKRRHDLIPNLVELVKGYAKHERDTLEQITRLRTESSHETDLKQKEKLEKSIAGDMRKLFALVEAYPDLKADQNFRKLHTSLIEVEDDLQSSRRYYNGSVRDFNSIVQSFPSNLVAAGFSFKSAEFFEVEYASERSNPTVEL